MVIRILLTLALAGVVVISTEGCSSASNPGRLAPMSTPVLRSSLTPTLAVAPRVGDVAPDFALDTLDGTDIFHLIDFSGQPVLLIFSAITCSSCVQEQPIVQKFYEQQDAGKQLVVLEVDIDQVSDFVKVATLRQRLGLTYPILVDDHFQARNSYHVTEIPVAYFLDRQHIIRSILAGPLNETVLRREASIIEG